MEGNSIGIRAAHLSDLSVLDYDRIALVMLWPTGSDLGKRATAARDGMGKALAFERLFTAGVFERGAGPNERQNILELAQKIPAKAEFTPDLKDAMLCGSIAGGIVRHVVAMATLMPEKATVTDAKKLLAATFARQYKSTKSIDNKLWPAYRPVAAYWAAWITLNETRGAVEQLPCRPDEVPLFLAIAEKYRTRAESTRLKQRGEETLLRAGETLSLPDSIVSELPEIDIDFTMRGLD